jgi:hypothetical protein
MNQDKRKQDRSQERAVPNRGLSFLPDEDLT